MVNPLVPSAFDLLVSGVATAIWAYAAIALISAIRSRHVAGTQFLVWLLVILFIPIIGPTAWFVVGRRPSAARSHEYTK